MRRLAAVALFFAACSGGSPDATVDLSPTSDLSIGGDLSSSGTMTCTQVLACAALTTTTTGIDACIATGTGRAQALFHTLGACLGKECGALPMSGGSGACGNRAECLVCVQTGNATDGKSNGPCMAAQGGSMVSDPSCGLCVDQLIACSEG